MTSRKSYIDSLVDEDLAPYEDVLWPSALSELRAMLSDSFETHPALSVLVREHDPNLPTQNVESGEVAVHGPAVEVDPRAKKANGHG